MKKYLACTYASFLQSMQFRLAALITIIGNFIYLVIIFNLWKGIYHSAGSDIINGLSFNDTMVYLVLAASLNTALDSYLVWRMGEDICSGKITLDLLKPLDYFKFKLSYYFGEMFFSFILTFIPTFFLVYFISGGSFLLSWNLCFFVISIFFSAILNVAFDFCVGISGFYTQSVWGVNTFKESVVMLLSGALIPLNFFPELARKILSFLPFQAMYNLTMQQLINKELSLADRFYFLAVQILWICVLIFLGKLLWKYSLKKLTVNGG